MAANIPGNEIQAPMSIVILSGLITATILNMVIIHVLFHHYGKGDTRECCELPAAEL